MYYMIMIDKLKLVDEKKKLDDPDVDTSTISHGIIWIYINLYESFCLENYTKDQARGANGVILSTKKKNFLVWRRTPHRQRQKKKPSSASRILSTINAIVFAIQKASLSSITLKGQCPRILPKFTRKKSAHFRKKKKENMVHDSDAWP